nr:MAG TPA: hypothetical protein [Bacteriophage sp.]
MALLYLSVLCMIILSCFILCVNTQIKIMLKFIL